MHSLQIDFTSKKISPWGVTLDAGNNSYVIDSESYPAGIYVLSVIEGDGERLLFSEKLIKHSY